MSSRNSFLTNLLRKLLKILAKNLFGISHVSHHQHVVPHDEGWAIKGAGNEKYTAIFDTQRQAINRAKEIAQNYKSSVVIHGKDGSIRDRISYK